MEAKMVIHDFEDLNTGVLEHTIFCIILEITPSLKDSNIGTSTKPFIKSAPHVKDKV